MGSCFSCCLSKDRNVLERYSNQEAPPLELKGLMRCRVVSVYDGDTVTVLVEHNGKPCTTKCRLSGIDCAELKRHDEEERKVAQEGKAFMEDLIGKELWMDAVGWGKYGGRTVGTLYRSWRRYNLGWEFSVNNELIAQGLAYRYNGRKKTPFREWYS